MEDNTVKERFTVHNKVPTFKMPEILISRKIQKIQSLFLPLTLSHM